MTAVLIVAAGYVAGSLPFGYWLGRLKGVDIRTVGSGNIGATNVWRTFGAAYGLPVVVLDVAKGFVPALVGTLVVDHLTGVLAGGAAMLGHWRPLFLRFERGGKTVATAGGVFFGAAPWAGIAAAAVWLVVFAALRYASVASMIAAASLPATAALFGYPWPVIALGALAAVVVVVLHRANIARLRAGTESRFHLRRRELPAR